jgi:hypothetical protein
MSQGEASCAVGRGSDRTGGGNQLEWQSMIFLTFPYFFLRMADEQLFLTFS